MVTVDKVKLTAFFVWCFITSIAFQDMAFFEYTKYGLWFILLCSVFVIYPSSVYKFLILSVIFGLGLFANFAYAVSSIDRFAIFSAGFIAWSSFIFIVKLPINLSFFSLPFVILISIFKSILFFNNIHFDNITLFGFDRPGLYAGDANYNAILGLLFLIVSIKRRSFIIFLCGIFLLFFSMSKSLFFFGPIFLLSFIALPSFLIYLSGLSVFICAIFYFVDINTLSFRGFLLSLAIDHYEFVFLPIWGNFRLLALKSEAGYSVHSHNTFVTIFYDFGVVVAVFFVVYFLRLLRSIDMADMTDFLRALCLLLLFFLFTNDFTHSLYFFVIILGVNIGVNNA